jgi:hypothetical protein
VSERESAGFASHEFTEKLRGGLISRRNDMAIDAQKDRGVVAEPAGHEFRIDPGGDKLRQPPPPNRLVEGSPDQRVTVMPSHRMHPSPRPSTSPSQTGVEPVQIPAGETAQVLGANEISLDPLALSAGLQPLPYPWHVTSSVHAQRQFVMTWAPTTKMAAGGMRERPNRTVSKRVSTCCLGVRSS